MFTCLNKKLKIFINYFVGPILFVWLSYSIYSQIRQQQNLQQSWRIIKASFTGSRGWMFYAVIVLMFFNWGIEARKWQVLIRAIQRLSFIRAFRAIFSGQALGLTTPNRIGEYAGRIVYLEEGNRLRAIALSATGSLAQTIVTFAMGIIGLIYMYNVLLTGLPQMQGLSSFWLKGLIYLLLMGTIALLLLYYNLSWVATIMERIPVVARYSFLIKKLEDLHNKELTRILLLSFTRYVVFVLQYLLLLQVFEVDIIWWQAVWLVGVQFLVMAIVPSIALAELGLRGQVGIALFGLLSKNTLGIIATSAGIWLINLIVPALAGSLLILGIRIFGNNK